ncbi:hypothetical protein Acr_17g0002300 [Actinidia rufa]|uniref:NADP-dependent oxidoreductase domain-containing protein n=1 Tax=Actinidia rufa TaxID=165716 RepID=A0A7J0G1J8_9ERIC|nr:hypothetical protein Acr_17g0002300 [Actinidia rufa]
MAVPLFNLAPDLTVSRLCLGTMTFGEQNSLPQSFQLLDKAFNSGINFFDSAEMYPVPQRAETQGRSEEYVGRWMRERKFRGIAWSWLQRTSRTLLRIFSFEILQHLFIYVCPIEPVRRGFFEVSFVLALTPCVATEKLFGVSGPSGQMTWIRDGPKCLDARNITEAIDNSYVPMFGDTEYDPIRQIHSIDIEEQLDVLGRAVDDGKIRYIGLSNETPYGVLKFLQVAERDLGRPKIVSVQNSYNLLCRNFDCGLAECCHHEKVSLLAYSPLAMGILSGKYFSPDGAPTDARLNLFKGRYSEGESRYNLSNNIIKEATKVGKTFTLTDYCLCFETLSLVASAVFGATKLWQLQEVLDACQVELNPEIIADVDKVHTTYPNPCP